MQPQVSQFSALVGSPAHLLRYAEQRLFLSHLRPRY